MVGVRLHPIAPIRFYSKSAEKPSNVRLVAELRKLTEVSITKAREALAASNNDVSAALQWLQNDLAVSGAKKAAKVAHRAASEGLVCASVLSHGTGSSLSSGAHGYGHGGLRAALVELNCETDFVASLNRTRTRTRTRAGSRTSAGHICDPYRASNSSTRRCSQLQDRTRKGQRGQSGARYAMR
jgi:elongation factor Ts